MTAAGPARARRERAQLAVAEAHLAVAQALVACMRAYAAAAGMYDILSSLQDNATGRAPAIVGEQQQRLVHQHRDDGQDCRSPAARTLAHLAMTPQQAGPSRRGAGILDTSSPDWAAAWPELEALARELAITQHAREREAAVLQEQLSHRESEVLRYLPSVLTVGEIGAEL